MSNANVFTSRPGHRPFPRHFSAYSLIAYTTIAHSQIDALEGDGEPETRGRSLERALRLELMTMRFPYIVQFIVTCRSSRDVVAHRFHTDDFKHSQRSILSCPAAPFIMTLRRLGN